MVATMTFRHDLFSMENHYDRLLTWLRKHVYSCKLPPKKLRKAAVMNMLKTFSNTSASKIEAIEPEGLHATITIV